jgi:Flp pilus assembly CpaE family ATPase
MTLNDLPEFAQEDVTRGIKVSSVDEAQQKVRDLSNLARQFGPATNGSKKGGS